MILGVGERGPRVPPSFGGVISSKQRKLLYVLAGFLLTFADAEDYLGLGVEVDAVPSSMDEAEVACTGWERRHNAS